MMWIHCKKRTSDYFKNILQKCFGICGLKDQTGKIKFLYLQYILSTIYTSFIPSSKKKLYLEKKFGDIHKNVLFSVYSDNNEKHFYKENINILELFRSFKDVKYSSIYESSFPECIDVTYNETDISSYFKTLSCDEDIKKTITYEDIIKCIMKKNETNKSYSIKVTSLQPTTIGILLPKERIIPITQKID